jgi:hypothetical protein
MGPAGTNVVGRNADWLTVPTQTWEREAIVRRDLANPATSATRDGDYEFSQMTGLVVMRVAIAVPDWVRRCVERGVANAIACVGPCWSLRPDKSQALDRGTELAGWKAAEEVEEKISALLAAIEDVRPVTPRVLTALQEAVAHPACVLQRAQIPRSKRDQSAMQLSQVTSTTSPPGRSPSFTL